MSDITVFTHEMFGEIRVTDKNGDPWFIAKDIADRLGYIDSADAIRRHCKKANKITQEGAPPVNYLIIPESDLYRLVMRSQLTEAEMFQDWVCEEVLPAIRKNGVYLTDKAAEDIINNPDLIIQLATQVKEERAAKQKLEIQVKEEQAATQKALVQAEYQNKALETSQQNTRAKTIENKKLKEKLANVTLTADEIKILEGLFGKVFEIALHQLRSDPTCVDPIKEAGRLRGQTIARLKRMMGLHQTLNTFKDMPSSSFPKAKKYVEGVIENLKK